MYDWPAVAAATAALHEAVGRAAAARGLEAEPNDAADPAGALLLHTCGLPFATRLAADFAYVATPVHAVEGCEGGFYSSAIVVRADDDTPSLAALAGRGAAINGHDSYSGALALKRALHAAGLSPPLFSKLTVTGSHLASMRAVAAGAADVAAVDAVCWALAGAHEAQMAARLRVLGWTEPAPALPLVTARRHALHIGTLRTALGDALAQIPEAAAALRLAGLDVLPEGAYAPIAREALDMTRAGWDWPAG